MSEEKENIIDPMNKVFEDLKVNLISHVSEYIECLKEAMFNKIESYKLDDIGEMVEMVTHVQLLIKDMNEN